MVLEICQDAIVCRGLVQYSEAMLRSSSSYSSMEALSIDNSDAFKKCGMLQC